MNPPLRKLTAVVVVMFVTLMAAVTYIQFFQAPSLNSDTRNVRTLYREYGTDRGPIIVASEPITGSEAVSDPYQFLRTYSNGPLYAPITGYFSVAFNAMTGIERSENSVLGGSDSSLITQRIQELVTGRQPQGGGVALTIDPVAQQAAWDALGNRPGAVVAIEPDTGRILAMVSKPTFDPNDLATHTRAEAQAAWDALNADEGKPLINRAIGDQLFAPGSSFKILTAAAMIESEGLTAESMVESPTIYSPPGTTAEIGNSHGICGDGSGQTTLITAFTESCNTTFAIGATEVGYEAMWEMAQDFGFGDNLMIPLATTGSRFPEPESTAALAMDGIGQRDVIVSPLQMAMMGAAVANDGVLMRPYLVDSTLTADLATISRTSPSEQSRPFSSQTAEQLRTMMLSVVENGTGRPAASSLVPIAGKTGSAEQGTNGAHAWFVGFDATDDPQVVVAAFVQNGGDGGQIAGPIASAVINAVVGQ